MIKACFATIQSANSLQARKSWLHYSIQDSSLKEVCTICKLCVTYFHILKHNMELYTSEEYKIHTIQHTLIRYSKEKAETIQALITKLYLRIWYNWAYIKATILGRITHPQDNWASECLLYKININSTPTISGCEPYNGGAFAHCCIDLREAL